MFFMLNMFVFILDLSHSDTRLSIVLNGFELHVYNRSDIYSHLEKVFGLESSIYPNDQNHPSARGEAEMNIENSEIGGGDGQQVRQRSEAAMARTWRDLIPVIKMDVSSGRLVFGNRLVPTTLSVTVEECHFVYSTKPPASTMDKLMHFTKCWAENARVMLAPSPKYTGKYNITLKVCYNLKKKLYIITLKNMYLLNFYTNLTMKMS